MAAPIVRNAYFPYRNFIFMVSFKVMKSIRYRMSSTIESCIEMSVPHTMSEDDVRKFIDEYYNDIVKLHERAKKLEDKVVEIPDNETYAQWHEKLEYLIMMVEQEMDLKAYRYTTRYMRSRWGSCSPAKKTISLNIALASLPQECTHYVLVHELCHLKHPDHSPAFWHMVERYFPDYRRVRFFMKGLVLQ